MTLVYFGSIYFPWPGPKEKRIAQAYLHGGVRLHPLERGLLLVGVAVELVELAAQAQRALLVPL